MPSSLPAMSDDASYAPEPVDVALTADDPVRTGVAAVDAVLDEVAALDGRSVEEHVAVFERAHETLRAALDPGSDPDPDA